MKIIVKTALFSIALLATQLAGAAVYKYIDENGNVAYGDKPVEGSEPVNIPGVRSSSRGDSSRESGGGNRSADRGSDDGEDENGIPLTQYTELAVLTPREGKIVDPAKGTVQIIMLPTPSLGDADQLIINIDGKDVNKGRDVNLAVKNLPNGKHTVSGRIEREDGKVVIESASVNFQIGGK